MVGALRNAIYTAAAAQRPVSSQAPFHVPCGVILIAQLLPEHNCDQRNGRAMHRAAGKPGGPLPAAAAATAPPCPSVAPAAMLDPPSCSHAYTPSNCAGAVAQRCLFAPRSRPPPLGCCAWQPSAAPHLDRSWGAGSPLLAHQQRRTVQPMASAAGAPAAASAPPAAASSSDAKPLVVVVAVVLLDASGRVLLAQRPPGKKLAGLWEFPGGCWWPGATACITALCFLTPLLNFLLPSSSPTKQAARSTQERAQRWGAACPTPPASACSLLSWNVHASKQRGAVTTAPLLQPLFSLTIDQLLS